MNNLKILPKKCRFFLSLFPVILILGLCLLVYTDDIFQTTQNYSITILVDIFQISNNSELQHCNLGWYISNIKQLRIAALQSWLIYSNIKQVRIAALQSSLIYFKYQTSQNCSITMLVVSIRVMPCAIWYHLCNFKNVKNTHGGLLLLVEMQAWACNFAVQMLTIRTRHHIFVLFNFLCSNFVMLWRAITYTDSRAETRWIPHEN